MTKIIMTIRQELPEIFSYSRTSVSEFISRIESRSSLLVFSGHELTDGELKQVYEFRHLTFQEFLAAKAIVDGYYPGHGGRDDVLYKLLPHIDDESWREVIPLVAVLAGRHAHGLTSYLLSKAKQIPAYTSVRPYSEQYAIALLLQFVIDEVQIPPNILKEVLEWIGRREGLSFHIVEQLLKSKYGTEFENVIESLFFKTTTDILPLGSALTYIKLYKYNYSDIAVFDTRLPELLKDLIEGNDIKEQVIGVLILMETAFRSRNIMRNKDDATKYHDLLTGLSGRVLSNLSSKNLYLLFVSCWALGWLGEVGIQVNGWNAAAFEKLFRIWFGDHPKEIKYLAAWALAELPLLPRNAIHIEDLPVRYSKTINKYSGRSVSEKGDFLEKTYPPASFVTAYYLNNPWTDAELADKIGAYVSGPFYRKESLVGVLRNLGEPGRKQLELLDKKLPADGRDVVYKSV